jgi:hypothetical protein
MSSAILQSGKAPLATSISKHTLTTSTPLDAYGKMRGLSKGFVGPHALQGNCHADVRAGALMGDVPVLVPGVP